jgi:hypothetical protein
METTTITTEPVGVLALTVPTSGPAVLTQTRTDLTGLQTLVGGWIERISTEPVGQSWWAGWVNEEGKIRGLPANPRATRLLLSLGWPDTGDRIVGTMVLTGTSGDDFTDLPEDVIRVAVGMLPGLDDQRGAAGAVDCIRCRYPLTGADATGQETGWGMHPTCAQAQGRCQGCGQKPTGADPLVLTARRWVHRSHTGAAGAATAAGIAGWWQRLSTCPSCQHAEPRGVTGCTCERGDCACHTEGQRHQDRPIKCARCEREVAGAPTILLPQGLALCLACVRAHRVCQTCGTCTCMTQDGGAGPAEADAGPVIDEAGQMCSHGLTAQLCYGPDHYPASRGPAVTEDELADVRGQMIGTCERAVRHGQDDLAASLREVLGALVDSEASARRQAGARREWAEQDDDDPTGEGRAAADDYLREPDTDPDDDDQDDQGTTGGAS